MCGTPGPDRFVGPMQMRFDGADGYPHDLGNFLVGESVNLGQTIRLALAWGQRTDGVLARVEEFLILGLPIRRDGKMRCGVKAGRLPMGSIVALHLVLVVAYDSFMPQEIDGTIPHGAE